MNYLASTSLKTEIERLFSAIIISSIIISLDFSKISEIIYRLSRETYKFASYNLRSRALENALSFFPFDEKASHSRISLVHEQIE